MKSGIKFIITYSILSLAFFGISKLIFRELSMEIFSYLLFYYFITLSLAVLLYPLLSWILEKYKVTITFKIILSSLLILAIINFVPFFYDNGRFLTLDIINGILKDHSLLGFNNLGIHIIAIISFILSYSLYHKDNYWETDINSSKASH